MSAAKPWVLDIACCQGGAASGYQRAGFRTLGVDTEPQPRYVGDSFIQADGLDVLRSLLRLGYIWIKGEVVRPSAVHTSWPCQGYTDAQRIRGNEHPMLIESGRELLEAIGLPYVQENVEGARQAMKDPIMLCGTAFGLRTYRHRLFESNVALVAPEHGPHVQRQIKMGRPITDTDFYQAVGNFSGVALARKDMAVPWMNRDGIRECIPPVYAEHIGRQLMEAL